MPPDHRALSGGSPAAVLRGGVLRILVLGGRVKGKKRKARGGGTRKAHMPHLACPISLAPIPVWYVQIEPLRAPRGTAGYAAIVEQTERRRHAQDPQAMRGRQVRGEAGRAALPPARTEPTTRGER